MPHPAHVQHDARLALAVQTRSGVMRPAPLRRRRPRPLPHLPGPAGGARRRHPVRPSIGVLSFRLQPVAWRHFRCLHEIRGARRWVRSSSTSCSTSSSSSSSFTSSSSSTRIVPWPCVHQVATLGPLGQNHASCVAELHGCAC